MSTILLNIGFDSGMIMPVVMILIGILVFFTIVRFVAKSYIKIPPNKVAIFYGRKNKTQDGTVKGYKVLTGGAKIKIPIIEDVQYLDLAVFSIPIQVAKAPNKDNILVTLKGVANVKIGNDEASLMAAAERFLGRSQSEIRDIAHENLTGHLRSIAGTMTIEDLVSNRDKLNQSVITEAGQDLKKMGLTIDLLTIQEVDDEYGYIEQLGRKRTAEVKMAAEVGTADAERESKIKTTTAQKDAELKANENAIAIAESEKLRDVKKASFTAEVATETAKAEQAGPLAQQLAEKAVVEAEQEKLKAQTIKKTEVAEAEALRKEQELIATVIKPAEAQKKADIVTAEASQQKQIIEAEGKQKAIEKLAEAEKQKKSLEGQGEAEAIKARALAEAEGVKAKMLAEAEGIQAKLLAEAEGTLKKAEAYKMLDDTGKFLLILEAVERILPAAIREFAGVAGEMAKPFGEIDNISIIDFGGGNGKDGTALSKFGQTVPEMLGKMWAGAQAMGIDLNSLFGRFGIDPKNMIGTTVQNTEKKDVEFEDPEKKNNPKKGEDDK